MYKRCENKRNILKFRRCINEQDIRKVQRKSNELACLFVKFPNLYKTS